jgi:hypothetical protein
MPCESKVATVTGASGRAHAYGIAGRFCKRDKWILSSH